MSPHFRFINLNQDWAWINAQIAVLRVEDTCGIIAIDDDTGEKLAVCVMDNWTHNSVQCHIAVPKVMVLRHNFLECCCDFIFNEVGLSKMYGQVPSNRPKAVKFNEHMGFTEKFRLEEAHAKGVDYIIMEMTKENCKYLQEFKEAA